MCNNCIYNYATKNNDLGRVIYTCENELQVCILTLTYAWAAYNYTELMFVVSGQ